MLELLDVLGTIFNPVVAALCLVGVVLLAVIQPSLRHQGLKALIHALKNLLIVVIIISAVALIDGMAIFSGMFILAFAAEGAAGCYASSSPCDASSENQLVTGIFVVGGLLVLANLGVIVFVLWRLAVIIGSVFQVLTGKAASRGGETETMKAFSISQPGHTEKFHMARECIRHKRFDNARAILATIDHPQAREWEAKLYELEQRRTLA